MSLDIRISDISTSSLFLLLLPLIETFYLPPSNPLLSFDSQVRERHLYTANKRQGLFLEIGTDGTVKGSPEQSANSVLELRSVSAGETVIRGVSSSLYLCVDGHGRLRGEKLYLETDCTFKESLANGYTLFLSKHHGLPVSLASKLFQEKQFSPLSQFLPLQNLLSLRKENDGINTDKPQQQHLDINSEDPFGMGLQVSVNSPGFHGKD